MSSAFKERLVMVGVLLGACGLMPLLAWALARLIIPGAFIEGPFLLMSPVAAIFVVVLVFYPHWGNPANSSVGHEEAQEKIDDIGQRLGIKSRPVYPQPSEDRKHNWPIDIQTDAILIFLDVWSDWDPRNRRFATAWLLARTNLLSSVFTARVVGICVYGIAASIVASLNLWTILVSHAIGLSIATILGMNWTKHVALKCDARALEATRDLASAQSFVDWQAKGQRFLGKAFLRRRREDLKEKAFDLGIKVSQTEA